MSTELIIALCILVLAFIIRMPLVFAMLCTSVIYFVLKGWDIGFITSLIMSTFYETYVIIAIPLFLFTANVMNNGTVTDLIFDFTKRVVGHRRGALAYVNVLASVIFSGMTGSALADAAGLGKIEIEAMRKNGYDNGYSCAITAASAVIGPVFPPSIPLVVFSMISGASVGALFLGGMIPGLLIGAFLMIYILITAEKNNLPFGEESRFRGAILSTIKSIPALLTPAILLFGIYSGVMTPTEAGAIAGLYALILAMLVYRGLGLKKLLHIILDTISGTGAISLMVGVAAVINYIITREKLGLYIENFITANINTQFGFLAAVTVLLLILGMFLDNSVILLVFVPILVPIAQSFGVNLVHFGVIVTLNIMIGLCTPPFGMSLFVVSSVGKTDLKHIIMNIWPMLVTMILVLILITYVPALVTFLPNLLMK